MRISTPHPLNEQTASCRRTGVSPADCARVWSLRVRPPRHTLAVGADAFAFPWRWCHEKTHDRGGGARHDSARVRLILPDGQEITGPIISACDVPRTSNQISFQAGRGWRRGLPPEFVAGAQPRPVSVPARLPAPCVSNERWAASGVPCWLDKDALYASITQKLSSRRTRTMTARHARSRTCDIPRHRTRSCGRSRERIWNT